MLKREVIEFYGSSAAAARAIGVSRAAVWQWGERVPAVSALKFSQATRGRLRFDPAHYTGLGGKKP